MPQVYVVAARAARTALRRAAAVLPMPAMPLMGPRQQAGWRGRRCRCASRQQQRRSERRGGYAVHDMVPVCSCGRADARQTRSECALRRDTRATLLRQHIRAKWQRRRRAAASARKGAFSPAAPAARCRWRGRNG